MNVTKISFKNHEKYIQLQNDISVPAKLYELLKKIANGKKHARSEIVLHNYLNAIDCKAYRSWWKWGDVKEVHRHCGECLLKPSYGNPVDWFPCIRTFKQQNWALTVMLSIEMMSKIDTLRLQESYKEDFLNLRYCL